jgi:hypothetical protein
MNLGRYLDETLPGPLLVGLIHRVGMAQTRSRNIRAPRPHEPWESQSHGLRTGPILHFPAPIHSRMKNQFKWTNSKQQGTGISITN